MVCGSSLIGTMWGLSLGLDGTWEPNKAINGVTFMISILAIFITLLPRLLSGTSILLAATPYVGVYIKKVANPANLYITLLFVVAIVLPRNSRVNILVTSL